MSAPSAKQAALARDLGVTDQVIEASTSSQLSVLTGPLYAARQAAKSAGLPWPPAAAAPAVRQSARLADPDHRYWLNMRNEFRWLCERNYAPAEAALQAVQHADHKVENRQCWPAEILQALSDRSDDSLRSQFTDERREFLSHTERVLNMRR